MRLTNPLTPLGWAALCGSCWALGFIGTVAFRWAAHLMGAGQ